MAENLMRRFEFVSRSMASDTFGVVRFGGVEGLSVCYRFEIELVSRVENLNLQAVLQNPATFSILREDGDIPFTGILAEFEQLHQFDEYTFYRAVLVPRLWWLHLTHHNQVFLDKSMPEFIADCLRDGGLADADFELRLQRDYPAWEYVCQYRESHFAFVSRWLEREGLYYYFEQTPAGEKLVITDTRISHGPMPEGQQLLYRPPGGMEFFHREEVVRKFCCNQRLLPRGVTVKDYNDQTPSLDLAGQAAVSAGGRGQVYLYGEHFRNLKEGNALAAVRAEEFLCRERRFRGESTVPYLRPGYVFQLQDHYRDDHNSAYLTVSLEHAGSQAAYLLAGLGLTLAEGEQEPYYRNTFVAIPADVQFRPERQTEKARFFGTLNAKVDASGSGQYAELDSQGRYKVILPFDLSGRGGGKASAWVRMMQPYAGGDHGLHFPLHKGTEVLLTFIDGDPDRPLIAGAVPNPATPSVVKDTNQTQSVLQTGGQSRIALEDRSGSERILLHVPRQGSFIRIGAPNDPATGWAGSQPPSVMATPPTTTPPETTEPPETTLPPETTEPPDENGIHIETEGDLEFKCKNIRETAIGNSFTMIIGAEESFYLGNYTHVKMLTCDDITLGLSLDLKLAWEWEFKVEGHGKFFPKKREYALDLTHMHLKKVDLEGEVTNLQASHKKLAGAVQDLTGETNKLAGATNKMAGEVSDLAGQTSLLTASTNLLAASMTNLSAEEIKMLGDATKTVAASTRLIGEHTDLLGAETKTVGEKTDLQGTGTIVTALHTII